MGWRSLFVPYKSEKKRQKIINTIHVYNSEDNMNKLKVDGAKLIRVVDNTLDKCIIFGCYSASQDAHEFFIKRNLHMYFYEDSYEEYFGHPLDKTSPLNIYLF